MNDPKRFLDGSDLPDQLRKDLTVARQPEHYETTWGFVNFLSLTAAIDLPTQLVPDAISSLPPAGPSSAVPQSFAQPQSFPAPQSFAQPQSIAAPHSIGAPTAVLPPPAALPSAASSSAAAASSSAAVSSTAVASTTVSSAWSLKALALVVGHGSYWGAGGVGVAATLITATTLLTAPSHSTALSNSTASSHSSAPSHAVSSTGSPALPSTLAVTPDLALDASAAVLDLDAISPDLASQAAPVFGLDDLPPALSDESSSRRGGGARSSARRSLAENTPAPGGLSDEVRELKALRQLLAQSPEQVLTQVQQSPFAERGALEPERQALAIEALVRLGRTQEAGQRVASYVARFPNSPAAKRWRCPQGSQSGPCAQP